MATLQPHSNWGGMYSRVTQGAYIRPLLYPTNNKEIRQQMQEQARRQWIKNPNDAIARARASGNLGSGVPSDKTMKSRSFLDLI